MSALFPDPAAELSQAILQEKMRLEASGLKPRLVLLDDRSFELLESDWIGEAKDLPWGDSLVFEMEQRRRRQGKMFLGDGTFLDLWVVRVETVEGFKVF